MDYTPLIVFAGIVVFFGMFGYILFEDDSVFIIAISAVFCFGIFIATNFFGAAG